MILLPTLHSELDDVKRENRTRSAGQKGIKQIEEFDRRGDTFTGVPLAGKLRLREVPISPDMDDTLPWLRSDVPDDAVVAGALELMWVISQLRSRSRQSDRNLRNKSRLAGLASFAPTNSEVRFSSL